MDKDLERYKKSITKYLKTKYQLSEDNIQQLFIDYDLDGYSLSFPEYFYYESPEYWAEFLISKV